jgi:hypothetical protein
MPNITNIPAPRVPAVDNNGLMTREWYRYLFNLFNLAGGGGSAISADDLSLAPVVQPFTSISSSPSTTIGYGSGAGGAVTQDTSRTTDVTLDTVCGQITLFSSTTTAGTFTSFTVNNAVVAATDVVIVNISSGATADKYSTAVTAVADGSFRIQIYNIAAVAVAEAPVLNFAIINAVNA